ncbi:DUF4179 domain-containing protein [Clostridium sp. LY3-2]|uniref:DUF4179 domain-containing protein n=1 Tax=Clostridium sp. LY3-2 TaxID=2942482 RepID=UPI002152826C|nr:DUF4179 domain-containing protein [Clostridium sp. LY3-2]MCR6516144.1 DUF4179 domain-containing protein [Clostridium sp. LY3-2]
MSKNTLINIYEDIEIPEELSLKVRGAIKSGKKARRNKNIKSIGISAAVISICFVGAVNASVEVAEALSKIPGIKELVELVKLDKDSGFDNAINEGLVQDINYRKEKDGVAVNINTIVGDYKRLWLDLKITVEEEVRDISITNDKGEFVDVRIMITKEPNTKKEYLVVGFNERIDKFNLNIKVINKEKKEIDFNIPIELDEKIKNSKGIKTSLNSSVETELGNLKVISMEKTNSRLKINFKLDNDIYKIYSFKNPRLIDGYGKEYKQSDIYTSYKNGESMVEFRAGLNLGEDIRFVCDGIYISKKEPQNIKIDLNKRKVIDNKYGFKIKSLNKSVLTLSSNDIYDIGSLDVINKNDGDFKGLSCSYNENNDVVEVECDFKLNKNNSDVLEIKAKDISEKLIKGVNIPIK